MIDEEYPKMLQEYDGDLDELRISIKYPNGEKVLIFTKNRKEVEENNKAWEQILAENKKYLQEHDFGEIKQGKGEPVVMKIPFNISCGNKKDGAMTNEELKKEQEEQEEQEIQTILCPYGYVDGANQCGCCEHFSDNGDGTECCSLEVGLNAYRLIYNHGYRKAKEVRKDIVIDICADLFRFLFPDEKRQCDMHDIVEFCNKWYVKVGLSPYDESAKEKYKSEIIEDD